VLTEYQLQLRAKYLAAPRVDAPKPWEPVEGSGSYIAVGLQGVGFGVHPDSGADLLMVVSMDGFGLINAETGAKVAREREPDPEDSTPTGIDLACPGIGVFDGNQSADRRVIRRWLVRHHR
jgi:hypothetical protein